MKLNPNFITIYTPTFNRAFCLNRLFDSLQEQKNKSFIWIVIDDGSTDNTKELIDSFIENADFEITYYYQQNKGKMEAINFVHCVISTELNVCMDSDDYMEPYAVDEILSLWKTHGSSKYAGLVGLDRLEGGELVGSKFPEGLETSTFGDLSRKHNVSGDKKFIYRTYLCQQYPNYPKINEEKFPAPGYLYRLIDEDFELLLFNKIWSVVEYLPDGISKNKFSQMKMNPYSFKFYREERIRLAKSIKEKIIHATHLNSTLLFIGKDARILQRPYVLLKLLTILPGIFLYLFLRYSKSKGAIK
jgi:glycosyltransferase involved in cell wall biosynthesis